MDTVSAIFVATLMISCVAVGFILGIIYSERKKGDKSEKRSRKDKQ